MAKKTLMISIDEDVLSWVREQAHLNERSMNKEISKIIKDKMYLNKCSASGAIRGLPIGINNKAK